MSIIKINRIRSQEKFVNIDGILITKQENVIYILGFKVVSGVTIFLPRKDLKNHDGKIWVFTNALEYDQVEKNIRNNKELCKMVKLILIPSKNPNFIVESINKLNLNCLGFEDDFISVKLFEEWKNKYKVSEFLGVSDVIAKARIVKTQEEIDRMKKAALLGDLGFKSIFETIKEGMTEEELAAEAEYAMRKAGSEGTSFDTIVASGELSAYPHAMTSNRMIQDGDIIIVDIGAIYKGYCSDLSRTIIFGKQEKEKIELINLVNDAQQYALDNIKAGQNCKDIDAKVRAYFLKRNEAWSSRFIHSLGHGVGIDIHESPYLSPASQGVLDVNMVVTVEPGLYIPGLGGARTEDQVVIKDDGYIILSNLKKYYY